MKKVTTVTAVILMMIICSFANADLTTGLVAYWDFNNCDAVDVTGNGHDGIMDSDPECVEAPCGLAWSPDGDDEIEIPGPHEDLMFNNQSLSISAWVQVTDNVNEYRMYVYLGRDQSYYNNSEIGLGKIRSGHTEGRLYFYVGHNGGLSSQATSIMTGDQIPLNEWLHLVGVVDQGTQSVRLYLNGEFQDESAGLIDFDLSTGSLPFRAHLGAYEHNAFQNGPMDEVRIYDRVLTEAEIQDLYYECNPNTPDTGSVHGIVEASGVGLNGVPVDLYEVDGIASLSTVTDENGSYFFSALDNGGYSVSISTPLGYQTAEETKQVTVAGMSHQVDFELAELEITPNQRSRGYWAHQLHKAMQYKPNDYSVEDFSGFAGLINEHFSQNQINPLDYYSVPQPADQEDSLEVLRDLLRMRITDGLEPAPKRKAKAQLIALMLNVVSEKVSLTHEISDDGRTVSQLITYSDMIVSDEMVPPDNEDYPGYDTDWYGYIYASFMLAKANVGLSVPDGMIPGDIDQIAYKEQGGLKDELIPRDFVLHQNYPNPFNPTTSISFHLPEESHVTLDVYNIMGQKVATLADEYMEAGTHSVEWTAESSAAASGIYFYRIKAGSYTESKKMMMLK